MGGERGSGRSMLVARDDDDDDDDDDDNKILVVVYSCNFLSDSRVVVILFPNFIASEFLINNT